MALSVADLFYTGCCWGLKLNSEVVRYSVLVELEWETTFKATKVSPVRLPPGVLVTSPLFWKAAQGFKHLPMNEATESHAFYIGII